MVGDISFALPLGEAKFGLCGGYVEGGERHTPTTDGGKLSFLNCWTGSSTEKKIRQSF
jgi:hypothetical protein